jgi:hypothetical protein
MEVAAAIEIADEAATGAPEAGAAAEAAVEVETATAAGEAASTSVATARRGLAARAHVRGHCRALVGTRMVASASML